MQPSTSVVARVHDRSICCAVLAKYLGIHFPEARGVHPLDVGVADLASGEPVGHILPLLDPSAVQEGAFAG